MKAKILAITMLITLLLGLITVQPGRAQTEPPTSTPTPVVNITVDPPGAATSGQPGAVVFYSLTVTNEGTGQVDIEIPKPIEAGGWTVTVDPVDFVLQPQEQQVVIIAVGVSGLASPGSSYETTIRILANGKEAARAVLTTTVASSTPPAQGRPLITIDSYSVPGEAITPGQRFDLTLRVRNSGQDFARNIILTYSGGDFLPVDTGGVRALTEIDPGEVINVAQPFIASSTLAGAKYASLTVNVSYTDLAGAGQYSETFTITINLNQPSSSGGVARPTATPTAVSRPQLVVSSYESDTDPLQPGSMFTLKLAVTNLGSADARSVTMVLGGGSADIGTPDAGGMSGGISGGSSDLSTFAPLGSSNLVYLGDLPAGESRETSVPLVVNVTASPAAYAFKISFVYDDPRGARQSNDQIITLLVYQLPQVEISFYRDPGMLMSGTMNMLPLQVINVGRKSTTLGNLKVTAANAELSNNVMTIGVLEPGFPFTLDVNAMPYQPGTLDLEVTVNYTDDFNQPREIVQHITVEVMEMPTPEPFPPGGEGEIPSEGMTPAGPETFWQKVVRFFKGLFGLDSSVPTPEVPGSEMPVEPMPGGSVPVIPVEPIPGGKGG